jgi:uncharacterized protein YndB with AHSA1/START domain
MGSGKTTADTDDIRGIFTDIVPNERICQRIVFASDDPVFAGEMEQDWTLSPVCGGTRVTIRATNVPSGITAADHATGMASTLANLARYLEQLS